MTTPTPPSVLLRPITDAECPDWKDLTATSFATGIGPVRGLNADEALKFAYEETERLLPDGPATEHHLIWIAQVDEQPVGSLWISLRSKIPFIFGIEVDSTQRGKGYGRGIMLAGQDECRRLGHTQIDLNVFADNTPAVALYDSLGYAVISQQMRVDL